MGFSLPIPLPVISSQWHGHEMFFGYTVAVISGFLLTAIKNWTSLNPVNKTQLIGLLILWISGRMAFLVPNFQYHWLTSLIDLSFLPCLIYFCAKPIISTKNSRNYFVIFLLFCMFIANILYHLEINSMLPSAHYGRKLFLDSCLILIILIANRVIPFFSKKVIEGYGVKKSLLSASSQFDIFFVPFSMTYIFIDLFLSKSIIFTIFSFCLTIYLLVKIISWYQIKIFKIPILSILYCAFFFITIGFAMQTAQEFIPNFNSFILLHCFSVAGIVTFTFGMIGRVSLGHSGQKIHASKKMRVAYLFIILASLTRVIGPLLYPQWHFHYIHYSAGFLDLAFIIFLLDFTKLYFQRVKAA